MRIVPAHAARQRIIDGRVLVLQNTVNLEGDIHNFGQVDMQRLAVAAVVADAGVNATLEHAGGRAADDVDRSAFSITAEQRALRSSEHFYLLNIKQRGVEAMLASEINPI